MQFLKRSSNTYVHSRHSWLRMVKGQKGNMFTAQQGIQHKQEAMCSTNKQKPFRSISPMPPRLSITGIKQIIKNDSQAPALWQIIARILTQHDHPVFLVALIKLNLPGYSTGTVVNSSNSECPCYEFRWWRCLSWQAGPDFRQDTWQKNYSVPKSSIKFTEVTKNYFFLAGPCSYIIYVRGQIKKVYKSSYSKRRTR